MNLDLALQRAPAPLRQVLRVVRGDCRGVPLQRLTEVSVLRQLLDDYAPRYPDAKPAAIASQWSMDYLCLIMPAVVGAALELGAEIDATQTAAELLLDQAMPSAIFVDASCRPLSPSEHSALFSHLFTEHLEPFVAALAMAGKVSPKLLWTNVVVVWDGLFTRLEGSLRPASAAHGWLKTRTVQAGQRALRPLQQWEPSPAADLPQEIPVRKQCCLHYRLHKDGPPVWCESCPKLRRQPLEEQLRYLRSVYTS